MKITLPERKSESLWAYLLLAPSMLLFVVFVLWPILSAFWISFTEWNLLTPPQFIGLANYRGLLKDLRLGKIIGNTLVLTTFSVIGKVSLGLILASLVASIRSQRLLTLLESALFFPVILPMAIVSMVGGLMFNTDFGVINGLLSLVGISKIPWLSDVMWALPTIIILDVWKGLGFFFIVYLVALRNVPKDILEAASIDGAGRLEKFLHVTLPIISPTTLFLVVIATIGSLQVFDAPYILTGGGPGDATRTMVYYLWQNAFQLLDMGYGNTLAVLLFVFVLIVTLIQFVLSKKWVFYE